MDGILLCSFLDLGLFWRLLDGGWVVIVSSGYRLVCTYFTLEWCDVMGWFGSMKVKFHHALPLGPVQCVPSWLGVLGNKPMMCWVSTCGSPVWHPSLVLR